MNELQPGQCAYIQAVEGEGALRHHLLDMGLTPGTEITLQKIAPMGDPVQIKVRGYELTLRLEEAQKIEIDGIHPEETCNPEKERAYQAVPHPGVGELGKAKKEREEDEKLQAVLQYTRNIFKQFDFSEEEIFQICECVRYFVSNRQALSVNIHIKRRTTVTQISLKNFAWNIAFQYNISRDVTAQFVMHTFHEWFANSTIDTVRKNLRTTTGKHKINIDENIISIVRNS